jgi:thiosulfate/3-mercaptopyruvate sulfurtransferase
MAKELVMIATALFMSVLATAGDAPAYARPELLVEVRELANPAFAQRFRILDARAKAKYDQGHIPGAVWVDHEAWSKAFGAKQDPKDWSEKIGELGIDGATKVVVYDDAMSKDAARIWWILRYWGVTEARLLNGGWSAWSNARLPVSTQREMVEAAPFKITAPDAGRLANKEKVLGILKEKQSQIIDVRSEKEFCGDDKLKNKRGGHIPGAVHLEWTEALDPETHKFKSAGDLTKILKDAGIDLTRPTVTHCQSGGRAAVMAFTLELMGAKEVANYYRGWSEWGNDPATPVVRPEKK